MDLLALRAVEVGHHRRRLLPPVDLTIRRGTFLGIVGPNGSGKTTLVRTMLGLLPPILGRIEHPRGTAPRFGYVPQRAEGERTFPLTTLDMVLMGRFPRIGFLGLLRRRDRELAREALARVGLVGLCQRPLHTLSGGQRQRALIARALCSEPEILVLDEPTSGMDLPAERSLLRLIEALRKELDLGVVMISHNLAAVADVAEEVLLLDRERQVVEHGRTGEVVTPERLSHLYGAPIAVEAVRGHRVIFVAPGEQP
jgi:ABC-type Mn2+/Zn2+ transport system ATPase subunit